LAHRMTARMMELALDRVPFVHATVVRAQEPTSARPGDDAIVLADGSIEGFVGGHCAEGSVRVAALGALESGETVLLRVLPDGAAAFPESPGAHVVVNPCLSGGALEIFLEPMLPPPLLHLVGSTPIADAVANIAEPLGFAVARAQALDRADGALAVIVSSLGREEADAIRGALDAHVPFIGLVASQRRGTAVLAEMDLTDAERKCIHTPVGIDIGARTPEEIALSIMAEIVRAIRLDALTAPPAVPRDLPLQVLDPVCGMTVVVGADTAHLAVDGHDHWFCGAGCRESFARTLADQAGR
jgi:xanthine dehydrogenase accessory factor